MNVILYLLLKIRINFVKIIFIREILYFKINNDKIEFLMKNDVNEISLNVGTLLCENF